MTVAIKFCETCGSFEDHFLEETDGEDVCVKCLLTEGLNVTAPFKTESETS